MAESAETLEFALYTPKAKPFTEIAAEVVLPGEEGIFTIMPQHTPLLTALRPGVMIVISPEGTEKHYAVHGGFAEVSRDRVLILTEFYELGDDIDAERAHAAQQRAEERLAATTADHDLARAESALMRARPGSTPTAAKATKL